MNSIIKITWTQAAQQVFLVAFWLEFWCLKIITIKLMFFWVPSSLCQMKRQGKHFLRFYHGCTAKKYKFFTFLLVLIFCLKIMNYFLCNLYNFVHFVFLFLWILRWASNSYIKIENMYSIKMDILLISILFILIFWV